jgi:spore germination cell wall hydrolase CwlJ-like protein
MANKRSSLWSKWLVWYRPGTGLAGLALLLSLSVPFMLGMTAKRGAVQLDNSTWQAFAHDFLDQQPASLSTSTAPDTQTYALDFVATGSKAAMAQDLRIMASLETFTKGHFETAAIQNKALDCLTTAIYYEARSESVTGQLAVAQVVLNRVKHPAYPDNVCDVVFEGAQRTTGCQFTFTCDGSMKILPRAAGWSRSRRIAIHALLGMSDVTIGRATHYHTTAISPYWSKTLLRTANIGSHIFYRFPSRREKALLLEAAYKPDS